MSKKYKGTYEAYLTLNGKIIKRIKLDSESLKMLVNA